MASAPVILITGASGGIGSAAAMECAQRGARVALHYHRNRDRAEATLRSLPSNGHELFGCDLTEPERVQQLVDEVDGRMGGIDVLVNNAGISQRHRINEIDYATWQSAWRRIIETNLTGPANLSFCVAKQVIARGGGRIINVSSRGAFRGEPEMPWYGASKAGLNAMGQSLAQALATHGVFVCTVAPGFVETEMAAKILSGPQGDQIRAQSPLGRVAQPQEVAQTIAYLAFDAPVFLTGCIVDINGASYLRS